MNGDTIRLIERPYQEIVDDVLTAIVGGVVNEPIIYDVKEDLYPLAQPARDVRGITGSRSQVADGARKTFRHTFQKEIDFVFSEGDNAIVWQLGGLRPDDETTFYVDYFRRDGSSPLSDINVGSVTRTLGEAVGREIATVYEQVNRAYLSGFIDTATGQSLDLVVAILGVTRKTKEYAAGLVTFFRDTAAGDGNVTIPEGVLLTTAKGEASFVSAQLRTLQRGQVRIDVPVRATDAAKGEAGKVKAGAITTLAARITGIAKVTNFEATILGKDDESDADLRARTKAVLRGLGKGTLLSLARVIFEGGATLAEVWDPNSPPANRTELGQVTLLIEAEPERFPSLRAGVEETRAAGVQATLIARYIFIKPRLVVRVAAGLTAAGKAKLIGQVIAAIQDYVDALSAGEPLVGKALIEAIAKGVREVGSPKNVTVADVMAWQSDVGRPGVESLVDTLVGSITAALAGDPAALRAAVAAALTQSPLTTPTNKRTPNRALVLGPGGARATDSEIEAAQFTVAVMIGGEKWWAVLDSEPADIVLLER